MFKFLFISTLLFNTAYAGNGGIAGGSTRTLSANSSWKEIRQYGNKLKLDNTWTFVGHATSIFEVCIDGKDLRTIQRRPIYQTTRGNNRNSSDTQVIEGYRHYSFPISYEESFEVCNNRGSNCRTHLQKVYQETVRQIEVSEHIRDTGGKDNRKAVYKKLFTKEYEVPLCSEIDDL